MKSQNIQNRIFFIIVIVMIIFVAVALYSDINQFSKAIISINYIFIPLIAIPMTIHLLLLGIRFHRLIRSLNISITLKKSILIYFAGLSLTVTPFGVGQIIKSHFIKKEFGDSISKTAPVILVEKWNELVAVIIILASFMLVQPIVETQIIIIIGIIIAVLLYSIISNSFVFNRTKKIFTKIRFLKSFNDIIDNSQDSLKVLMKPKMIVEGLLLTVPAKILEGFSVFLVFYALNLKIDMLTSVQIFFISIISGIISFIPGGLIVTEGTMIGLLTKYGVELGMATAVVIITRLMTIWYATFVGLATTKLIIKKGKK